jgi:tetratricopeptide (TPR) repeat protein
MKSQFLATGLAAVLAVATAAAAADKTPVAGAAGKIPITTSSEEARQAYLQGRDLADKLKGTDARRLYEQAVAKDPGFTMAWVGLANTSGTAKEFFAALEKAVAAAPKASEGEKLVVAALDAGARGEPAKQKAALTQLVQKYPQDERAHNALGLFVFGQQDWAGSAASFKKATTLNPEYSQPYNQLGYAHRFLGQFAEAEKAFQTYIALIPNDPNPYDSYAELLMKVGRFDESIKSYEKALAVDPNFVASHVGIGNNYMFMGKGEEARQAFARLLTVARNDGEMRQALFWNAMSYVHEGDTARAVAEIEKQAAIARASGDLANLSGDYNQMGDILLEAGQVDAAAARYKEQLATIDQANVPAEVKAATHRNGMFDQARVQLARGDVAGARATAAGYAKAVAVKNIRFEVLQSHELNGRVALAARDYAGAAAELKQANQQDPRVLYLLATALQGKGDGAPAKTLASQAADFNALSGTYGYVRGKAKAMAN